MILSATAVLTAVWLEILTSMSFIGKDLSSPRRVLLTEVLYTLGRSLAYGMSSPPALNSISQPTSRT